MLRVRISGVLFHALRSAIVGPREHTSPKALREGLSTAGLGLRDSMVTGLIALTSLVVLVVRDKLRTLALKRGNDVTLKSIKGHLY